MKIMDWSMIRILFLCFLVPYVLAGEFGKHGLRRVRRDELPRAMPPATHNTTMFKLHTYEFTAKTTIDHFGGEQISDTIKAQFSWDQIHSDMDSHSITRFKLLECLEGDCGQIETNKSFFIELRQGRQTLRALWKNNTDPAPKWNILHTIIMALTLPTEDQQDGWYHAQNPLGNCQYRFGKKNDTQHLREIQNCDFSMFRDESLISNLYSIDYKSDVELNMDAKINGKLHLVRGSEKFRLHSPLHPKFGYTIHTEISMKLIFKDDPYALRFCNGTWSSNRCATEAFDLELVGSNWKEVMNGVEFEELQPNEKILSGIKPENRAAVFLGLNRLLHKISPMDFVQLLNSVHDENQKIQHIQSFAAVGEVDVQHLKKHLIPGLFEIYLQALAHRVTDNRVVIQELKKLIDKDKSELPVSVFAALINRDCHQTPSKLNNCNNGDNSNILKLLGQLETCNMDSHNCDGHATFAALDQLPIEKICKHAAQLVCMSENDVHGYVLNILSKCDPSFFKPKDIRLLMNVFHNSCYEPVKDSWSLQALDILLNSYHKQPLAGTLLLRSEVESLEKPEKWSYFHQAERALLKKSDRAVDGWQQLRNFKVFERNYNNHAIKGNSSIDFYTVPLKDFGRLGITVRKVGSNQTLTRTLNIVFQKENSQLDLLSLRQEPEGNRLSLLGTAYPNFEWENQQINIQLSDFEGRVPLISGRLLEFHSTATLSLDFQPALLTNDFRFKVQLHLLTQTEAKGNSILSTADLQTLLVMQKGHLSMGELEIRQSTNADSNGHERHIKYPGVCLRKVN